MSNIERCGFFSSQDNDRLYSDDDFCGYFSNFITTGVFQNKSDDSLLVEANGTNKITVRPGKAWLEGRVYELLSDKEIEIHAGDASLDRIDLVVVKCDYVERDIYITIKQGIPSSTPTTPTLQRDTDAFEIAIASYKMEKGAINVSSSQIVDTRKDLNLAGEVTSLIDKHNLKEFLKDTGFIMRGDINSKDIYPLEDNVYNIGSAMKRYKTLYIDELDVVKDLPYLKNTGGTVEGRINSMDISPITTNVYRLGNPDAKWREAYITDLHVYGTHPFIAKTGGEISGTLTNTLSPNEGISQGIYKDFDGNGDTLIGQNSNGKCTHVFSGKGDFIVNNPVARVKDIRAEQIALNGKRLYIQSEAPTNAVEGSVWIQV